MIAMFRRENPGIQHHLVAELAHTSIPTATMGAAFLGVVLAASTGIDSTIINISGALGVVATLSKLSLMVIQRRAYKSETLPSAQALRWETAHFIATLTMASSVSGVATTLFLRHDPHWHLLATALLFGYCAGIVSRLGMLPRIAVPALCVAAIPVVAACASWRDPPHLITALIFTVFLMGSFETVRHVQATAVRHIATRLDMATLARNDALTGLSNRLGLREGWRSLCTFGSNLAVYYLDLDGFKSVNDRFGHAHGDLLLKQVAKRMAANAPDSIIARLGGDEFAIIRTIRDARSAMELAEVLVRSIREEFVIEGTSVRVGASLGYVFSKGDACDLDELLNLADKASYEAKRAGGGIAGTEQGTDKATQPSIKLYLAA